MIQTIIMLVGSLIWLFGEAWGVWNDAHGHRGIPDTTSGWVWLFEHKFSFGRMLVAAGLAALAVHFLLV